MSLRRRDERPASTRTAQASARRTGRPGTMVAMVGCPWLLLGAFDTAARNRWWIAGVALFAALTTVGFVVLLPLAVQRRKPPPMVSPRSVALTTAPDPAPMRPVVRAFLGSVLVAATASSLNTGGHHHFRLFFASLLAVAAGFLAFGFFFGLYRALPDVTHEELQAAKQWHQGQLGKLYFAAQLAPEFRRAGRWLITVGAAGLLVSLLLKA